VQGTVRDATGGAVSGALVELSSDGSHLMRVLSDERGRYSLRVPAPGRYQLRVLRIGFHTTSATEVAVPPGGATGHDLVAPAVVVRLEDVEIRAEKRCIVRPEEGLQAAALWEEARKALFATELIQQSDAYSARIRHYERGYDRRARRVMFENGWEEESMIAQNPFATIGADALADSGYIREESSGADVPATVYHAPDAHVLVAERFLDTHCFRVEDRDRASEGLIGLEFEPVQGRRLPDVRGTLWIDRRSSELRSLDYYYTELPRAVPRDRAGGRLIFQRLPSGAWIVQSWWIRMPVFVTIVRQGRDSGVPGGVLTRREERTQMLTAFRERGAEVITAQAVARNAPVAAIAGTVIDHTRALPLTGAVVRSLQSERSTTVSASGAFRLDSLAEGTHSLVFSHPRADSLGLTAIPYTMVARVGELSIAHLGIPARAISDAGACADSLQTDSVGIIAGVVRDADTDRPVPDVAVVLIHERASGDEDATTVTMQTDANGDYRFCGVPRGGQVSLRAERAGTAGDRHQTPLPRGRLTLVEIRVRVR